MLTYFFITFLIYANDWSILSFHFELHFESRFDSMLYCEESSLMAKTISFLLALFPCSLLASGSPTTATAIVLPGLHEQGEDLQGYFMPEASVIDWELSNNDLVFGSYSERTNNERIDAVGYMYNQKLEFNAGWLENDIRNYAENNDLNYEDFFLHFSEDTILAEVDKSHGENTLINRKPIVVGYTASDNHAGFWLYQQPPWDADVFEHANHGGALFIYHSDNLTGSMLNFLNLLKAAPSQLSTRQRLMQTG